MCVCVCVCVCVCRACVCARASVCVCNYVRECVHARARERVLDVLLLAVLLLPVSCGKPE